MCKERWDFEKYLLYYDKLTGITKAVCLINIMHAMARVKENWRRDGP